MWCTWLFRYHPPNSQERFHLKPSLIIWYLHFPSGQFSLTLTIMSAGLSGILRDSCCNIWNSIAGIMLLPYSCRKRMDPLERIVTLLIIERKIHAKKGYTSKYLPVRFWYRKFHWVFYDGSWNMCVHMNRFRYMSQWIWDVNYQSYWDTFHL